MRISFVSVAIVATLLSPLASYAQAAATAPIGSTAMCKDGSYSSSASKKGACQGHKGVKDWYTTPVTAQSAATPTASQATSGTSATPSSKSAAAVSTPAASTTASPTPATTRTPIIAAKPSPTGAVTGSGAGKVWVNTNTNVYHCANSKFYGKTKAGSYMTEAAAKTAGARPNHGKACS